MMIYLSFSSEGDRDKFEFLYNKYKKLLLYKAYEILRDYSYAEDAVSEAFIRIYKNLHKIEEADSNKSVSFIVTIVKNVSLTILQGLKTANTQDISDYQDNMLVDEFRLEDYIISERGFEEIMVIVDGLKEELKAPFLLKYAHGLSHSEIAKILNISENNVTVRIHRAKKKLAGLLSERRG